MKPILACTLAACALPSLAVAQSSVTLYGIVDATISYTNNQGGHAATALIDGGPALSRWGLRGEEDLGDGLKAIFTLENGFNPANGTFSQNNRLFGRQSFVGLQSQRFGTVKLGRQYDETTNFLGPFGSAQTTIGSFSGHPGDVDDLVGSYRINNSISYTTPTIGGFSAGVLGSLGGQAGAFSVNSTYSVGVRYAIGNLSAAAAYGSYNRPNTSMWDGNATTLGPLLFSTPLYSGYASATTLKIAGAGIGYNFGAATVNANYTNYRFQGLGSNGGPNPMGLTGNVSFNTLELNGSYYLTPALMFAAAWQYDRGATIAGSGGQHYNQFSAIADYFLSKRTDLYLSGAYEIAGGTNSLGKPAVAAINTVTPSSNDRQVVVRVGIRSKF